MINNIKIKSALQHLCFATRVTKKALKPQLNADLTLTDAEQRGVEILWRAYNTPGRLLGFHRVNSTNIELCQAATKVIAELEAERQELPKRSDTTLAEVLRGIGPIYIGAGTRREGR